MKKLFKIGFCIALVTSLIMVFSGTSNASTPSVVHWGANFGSTPNAVAGIPTNPVAIDAGNQNSAEIAQDGTIWYWGLQPVQHFSAPTNTAQIVDGDGFFTALSAPSGTSGCPTDTTVWTWGKNVNNQLGVPVIKAKTPVEIPQLTDIGVVWLASADNHTYAMTCTGQVYVWGWNQGNVFGSSTFGNTATPRVRLDHFQPHRWNKCGCGIECKSLQHCDAGGVDCVHLGYQHAR